MSGNLTEKQLKLLELAACDIGRKEIADRLGVKYKTVDNQFQNLYQKFNCHSRVGLVVSAIRQGVVRVEGGDAN